MLEIAKRNAASPVKTPRAHLEGLNIPAGFVLPSLAAVRADAARSKDMQNRPEDFEDIVFFFPPGTSANAAELPSRLRLPLVFNNLVPSLFKFSYFAREHDVPEDVVDDCIWALSQFILVMEECSEAVLRAVGHVRPGNPYNKSKYATLLNARGKIAHHLLRTDRALEAVPYAKAMVDEECSRQDESWLLNPMVFELYGETLVCTRTDDGTAVKMLRRAMLGIESVNWPASGVAQLVTTRVVLSRALRNIGADDEAKPHETWAINWLRKNPVLIEETDLKALLLPAAQILDGLGGEEWLTNRKSTTKSDERRTKACRTCGAREPKVTLSKCNNCKYIFYCSRDCQRAHWKHHKVECREMAETAKKIELLSLADPEAGKRASDWSAWCNANHAATQWGLIHALGFHRDPQRGRTHILIKEVAYVPGASKLKHKFRVVACGVFRIADVLRDIESHMRLDFGEGQEYVDSLFAEIDGTRTSDVKLPFIDLSFGEGVSPWLGSGATNMDGLDVLPYDPDWRKQFNAGAPPGPLKLRSGAKDAEHVF